MERLMSGRKSKAFDFEECACSGKTLGKLVQPYIMALLTSGPSHGYALLDQLAKTGVAPDHSVVYRTLNSMEKDGLVASRRTTGSGGPTRSEYRLTPTGRACLRRWQKSLSRYRAAIDALIELMHS